MRIVQLSGLQPILGEMQSKSMEQRKAYRLMKLNKALANMKPNSFTAHLIRNEIKRITGAAEMQPQGNLREYAGMLQDRLKLYKDQRGISWLINKELKMISENRFKGSTATGKAIGEIEGIGRRKKRKGFFRKIGKGLKKAFNKLKTVSFAVPRNAFLGLLRLNLRGLASKLNRAPKDKIFRLWDRLGGKRSSLEKAISKGAKKKPLLGAKKTGKPVKRIRGFQDADYIALEGFNNPQFNKNIAAPPAAAAVLAAAAPIIIAFTKLLKKEGIDTKEGMIDPDTGEVVEKGTGSVLENIAEVVTTAAGGQAAVEEKMPSEGFTVADPDQGAVPDAGYPSDDPEINDSTTARTGVTISPVLIGAAALGVFLLMKK
jgi:hypothetical protein